jgi:hypothetical protein
MIGLGVFSWFAGALQLVIPSYALRLVRRFGTHRVGWFLVTAFLSLALLHLVAPVRSTGVSPASGVASDLVYLIGSVLLLIGMGHMETVFSEREQANSSEQSLRKNWESRLKNETAELIAAKEELLQELARRDEIQQAFEDSEARYRFLFTENPQPMWILDLRSCRFLAANHAAVRQYGFTLEEFMELTGQDLLLPANVPEFLQDASKPCAGVEARGVWRHCKKDGTLLYVEITAVDLMYAESPARLIVATDITERRRRELKQREAHKMEVISQVAGGVAHHFNNILTILDGNTSALMEKPVDLQSAEQLEQISAAITRASGLTRQLLAAGGRQMMNPEPVDLNGLIKNLNQTLRRLLGEGIALENIYASHLPSVQADRHLVENVIINLALNSREAMPNGGTLTVSTAKVHVDKDQAERDPQVRAGDFVRLEVRDTGCGMTPQIQSRLFEPFFTTRDPGTGMGLGLASVHGVVSQHSGWIEFSSEVGAGAEFRVFLPCAPAPAGLDREESQTSTSSTKGTIFLVEAEDRVRALARFVLNHHGYRVIEADGPATALVLWAGQAPIVDLLLTDVHLPGDMSGRELADQLRRSRPDLKVIYSGECDSSLQEQNSALLDGTKFIAKPYNPDSLVQAVQSSLGC